MNETMVSHAALNRAKFAVKSYTLAVSKSHTNTNRAQLFRRRRRCQAATTRRAGRRMKGRADKQTPGGGWKSEWRDSRVRGDSREMADCAAKELAGDDYARARAYKHGCGGRQAK